MTTLQLKEEIHKAVDKVPENVLPELLEYVNSIQYPISDKIKRAQLIDKIFEEDDNLLRRLAE